MGRELPEGRRRRSWAAALGAVAVAAAFAAAASAFADAASTFSLNVTATSTTGAVVLDGKTYAGAAKELREAEASGSLTLPVLPVGSLSSSAATLHLNETKRTIAVKGETAPAGSTRTLLATATWQSEEDTQPEVAVLLVHPATKLSDLNPGYTGPPVHLSKAWTGVARTTHKVAVASLPDEVAGLLADGDEGTKGDFAVTSGSVAFRGVADVSGADAGVARSLALLDGRGSRLRELRLEGTLAANPTLFTLVDDAPTQGMDLKAQGVTIDLPSTAPSWLSLDSPASLKLTTAPSGTPAAVSTRATLTLDRERRPGEASLALLVTKDGSPKAELASSLDGSLENVLGRTSLDLTHLGLAGTLDAAGLAASITGTTSFAGHTVRASFEPDNSSKDTGTVTLGVPPGTAVTTPTFLDAIDAVNAEASTTAASFADKLPEKLRSGLSAQVDGFDVLISNVGERSVVSALTRASVSPLGAGELLLRASGSDLLLGAGLTTLKLSDVLGAASALPVDIPFRRAAVVFRTGRLPAPRLDALSKSFFEPHACDGHLGICGDTLPLDGVTLLGRAEVPQALVNGLAKIGVKIEERVLAFGYIPLFDVENPKVEVTLDLPTVNVSSALGEAGTFVRAGDVDLLTSATTDGKGTMEFSQQIVGTLTLGIPRVVAGECASPATKEKVAGTELCIDAVKFDVTQSTGAKLTGTGVDLSLGLGLSVLNWTKPFGLPWVSFNNVSGTFGVSATTDGLSGGTLGFSAGINLDGLGIKHEETGAVLMTVSPQPPYVELKGITRAVSAVDPSDLVKIANAVASAAEPSIDAQKISLPTNLSLRNLYFSYGKVLDTGMCITPGLRLQAELHLGTPPDGGSPQCIPDATASEVLERCRAAVSCLGLVHLDARLGGAPAIRGTGFARGRDLKVVNIEDYKLLFDLSTSGAHLAVEGGGTIRDPVDVANGVASPRTLATGRLKIALQAETRGGARENTSRLKGEVVLAGSLLEAYVEGMGKADLSDPDYHLDVYLRSSGLQGVTTAIDTGVRQMGNAVREMDTLVNGVAVDSTKGAQDVLNATKTAFSDLGASAPATLTDIVNTMSSISGTMNTETSRVSGWLGSLASTAEKVGLTSFSDTLNGYRNNLSRSVPDLVGAALHGVDLPDFGGIYFSKWGIGDAKFCPYATREVGGRCQLVPAITLAPINGVCSRVHNTDLCADKPRREAVVDGVVMPEALREVKSRSGSSQLQSANMPAALKKGASAFGKADVGAECAVFNVIDAATTRPAQLSDATLRIDALGARVVTQAPVSFSGELLGATAAGDVVRESFDQAAALSTPKPEAVCDPKKVPAGKVLETNPVTISLSSSRISADEGGVVTVTGSLKGNDAGSATVALDWGDGGQMVIPPAVAEATLPAGDEATFTATHTYADDAGPGPQNTFLVRASVEGTTESATALVTVRNANPSVSIETSATGELLEGSEITLHVGVADEGRLDTHALSVDWGDGSPQEIRPAKQLSEGSSTTTFTHRFIDDGVFSVRVAAIDKDGGTGRATSTITVANVAPQVSALRKVAVLAGESVDGTGNAVGEGAFVQYEATVTDPGALDVVLVDVDWGDGQTETAVVLGDADAGNAQRVLALFHAYSDDDPTGTPSDVFTVKLRPSDDDGGEGVEARTDVTVHNFAPVVEAANLHVGGTPLPLAADGTYLLEENRALVELRLEWSDVGLLDTHSVTIDWGEGWGTTTVGPAPDASAAPWWSVDVSGIDVRETTLADSGATRRFHATNRYGDNGTYDIVLTVEDDDLGKVTRTLTLVVDNVVPVPAIDEAAHVGVGATAFMVREDTPFDVVARADDPGSDDLSFAWAAGDGSTSGPRLHRLVDGADDATPSPQVGPRIAIEDVLRHQWAEPCLYDVSVGVDDDDWGTARDRTFVAVIAAAGARQHSSGWWSEQFRNAAKGPTAPHDVLSERLGCYLRTVDHLSSVFEGLDHQAARRILEAKPDQRSDPLQRERETLDRRLLGTWLNLANGVWDWHTLVEDRDGDRRLDVTLGRLLSEVEEVRETSTDRTALSRASNRLFRIGSN